MYRRAGVITPALLLLVLALTGWLVACGGSGAGSDPGTDSGSATDSPGSQEVAPGFSGKTIDGQEVSLEGFKGKPLILVFWASW